MSLLVEDRALLERFRAGDVAALATVYRAYAPRVAGFLHQGFHFEHDGQSGRFLGYGSAFELQDAVQETFARAFAERARQAYDGLRPYGSFLMTIARNLVLDELRAAANRMARFRVEPEGLGGAAPVEVAATAAGPERAAQQAELRALVQIFIQELSGLEREVLEHRFRRGLSQRDAAEAIGMTRMRLRTVETRIRKKVLRRFAGTGYLPRSDPAVASSLLLILAVRGGG